MVFIVGKYGKKNGFRDVWRGEQINFDVKILVTYQIMDIDIGYLNDFEIEMVANLNIDTL